MFLLWSFCIFVACLAESFIMNSLNKKPDKDYVDYLFHIDSNFKIY